jgi:tripartite-type tricarboxylate transporter receptor subunit TctC
MKLPRRRFLQLAGVAGFTPALSQIAAALDYPIRPVRLIVGYPAGGGTDSVARLIGQWLSDRLGQPFMIENRPGAGTNIATEAVVNAAADGYTILLSSTAGAINATFYDKLKFNFLHDLVPVGSIVSVPLVMQVHPSFPANSVPEFIAYAKANPGKISMASPGAGTAPHLAGELFKMMAGINIVHVPYRGEAPALSDLIGGQVQVLFPTVVVAVEQARAGKLKSLGISTSTRLNILPDIRPIADFLPGYEASAWYGISAPRNTPKEIVEKLNKEIQTGLADPKMKARMADMGLSTMAGSTADYQTFIANEVDKWAKVVKFSGAKAE